MTHNRVQISISEVEHTAALIMLIILHMLYIFVPKCSYLALHSSFSGEGFAVMTTTYFVHEPRGCNSSDLYPESQSKAVAVSMHEICLITTKTREWNMVDLNYSDLISPQSSSPNICLFKMF